MRTPAPPTPAMLPPSPEPVAAPAPAARGHGSEGCALLGLPDEILFEKIVSLDLAASLGRLSRVSRPLRDSLRAAFHARRTLALLESDATLGFAEELVKLDWLEMVTIGDRRLYLDQLRHDSVIDLAPRGTRELTLGEASILAPFLRFNRRLRWLRLTAGPTTWIDVGVIRRGGKLSWRAICKGAPEMQDAECIVVAGLLEPCAARGAEASGAKSSSGGGGELQPSALRFEMELCGLSVRSGLALAAAEERCGQGKIIRIKDEASAWLDDRAFAAFAARRPPRPSASWSKMIREMVRECPVCVLLLLLTILVSTMRLHEDGYARSTGYHGALLSNHPLRLHTVSEHLALEQRRMEGALREG